MIHRLDEDGIVTLRMEHGKAQALDTELLADLGRALEDVGQADARAVILTGTGTIFSAGVDLVRLLDGGKEYLAEFLPALTVVIHRLFELPLPVIAAVNGHAIAGGCILAGCADHRIGVDGSARIGAPELLVGVPFPVMALEVIRYCVPRQHIQDIVYGGLTYPLTDAIDLGLIDEIVAPEELTARAVQRARGLAAIPLESFQLAKMLLRQPTIERFERYSLAVDSDVMSAWSSGPAREAIRRYVAKTLKKP